MVPISGADSSKNTQKPSTPKSKKPGVDSGAKHTPKPPETPTSKGNSSLSKPKKLSETPKARYDQVHGQAAGQPQIAPGTPRPRQRGSSADAIEDSDDEPMTKVKKANGDLQAHAQDSMTDDDDDDNRTVVGAQRKAQYAGNEAKNSLERSDDTAKDEAGIRVGDEDERDVQIAGDEAKNSSEHSNDKAQDTAGTRVDDEIDQLDVQHGDDEDDVRDDQYGGDDDRDNHNLDTAGGATNAADSAVRKRETSARKPSEAKVIAGDAAERANRFAQETTNDALDTVDDAQDTSADAKDTVADEGKGTIGTDGDAAVKDHKKTDNGDEDARREADDAEQRLPDISSLPLDLSVLEGLTCSPDDGLIYRDGQAIGKLVEGDAEDLGNDYPISADGEILDEDGDLVGRCELLPEEMKRQLHDKHPEELPEGTRELLDTLSADAGGELPDINILEGYTCTAAGEIFNDDGDRIGLVEQGEPGELQHCQLNHRGEFVNEQGEVKGRAKIDPEAADLLSGRAQRARDVVEDPDESAERAPEQAPDTSEQVQGAAQTIEDQLPGIEALQGRELNEAGQVLDPQSGNVLANLNDDHELKDKLEKGEVNARDLTINESGEVVDDDGNVLGHVELAEGAAESLNNDAELDIRILTGKKVNKAGKILDFEGEVIGELISGELKACSGKKIVDDGRILDKDGKELGRVSVVPCEAAEMAHRELLEELGESTVARRSETHTPSLDALDGLKVNKRGKVLDEEGEEVGELEDGEPAVCAGKKINAGGEVLGDDGSVIGHVKPIEHGLAAEQSEAEEHFEEPEETAEAHEAEGSEQGEELNTQQDSLPPLSALAGLKTNKLGRLVDDRDIVLGELIEGDAKKLAKLGIACDEQGVFWQQGKQIGKAKTVALEDGSEEAPFAGLENLIVSQDGWVIIKDTDQKIGIVEGEWKKLVGRSVDEDGDILSKNGTVVGHAERYEEPEAEQVDSVGLSSLRGKTCTKTGYVMGDEGVPLAKVIQGQPKSLSKLQLDAEGQFWSNGKVIGAVELIPQDEQETEDGVFAGYEGLHVIADGKVADCEDNVVGQLVEGAMKKLVGMRVDADGEIMDKFGQVKGRAEPIPEEDDVDYSIFDGLSLNKKGFVVNTDGSPVGKIISGDPTELAGRKCDENGFLYNDQGKVVGKCEPLPPSERPGKSEGPFAGLEGLHVADKHGSVCDSEGRKLGIVTQGEAKRLVGLAVDEDGDILDRSGNVKGHADPYEEDEEEAEDLSALHGCTVNKKGFLVDGNKTIIGKVSGGDIANLVGRVCGKNGIIFNDSGEQIGSAQLVHDQPKVEEGPFAGFEGDIKVQKDGSCILVSSGDVVGRVVSGEVKKLHNRSVKADGSVLDSKGNEMGSCERWEPEEKEKRVSPMSGCKINREGEVRNADGELLGRLTSGDLGQCVGASVDDSNNVLDGDGDKIGVATILENIAEEEVEEETPEDETEEQKHAREERELAKKMTTITRNTIDQMSPVCKKIKERLDQADSTPKEELDEQQLVNDVKPMIEEGGRILQECNGSLKGLDPDGSIAARAKGRSGSGEASPEEHALAENLKELSTNVVGTIDDAKKRLQKYPQAKRKLNPLWGLLTQPLFGILAAVGILLSSVVALLGQILTLGQFNLLRSVLGHFIGFDKLFGGLDKVKKKAGDALKSIPVIGGMLGGK